MAAGAKSTVASRAGSSPAYFVDHKKGEVNELKNLLRSVNVERTPSKKREVVKKVIAYMTLGYDVSRLFGEIVMASATTDIIVKKMCYLYLSRYAQSNEELATLVINTMTKDCQDSDPMIRGLALRTLSSLRLASTVEYLMPVLERGLDDPSPYVRRNAVMAVLKLYHLQSEYVVEGELVDKLYGMIRDPDAQVITCCLMALNEIMLEEGGIAINKSIIYHLLNQIKLFNEWGQCMVLGLVAKYRPADHEEMFAIMNVLEGLLRVSNSAVVLGATKCFLQFAESVPDIKYQVYNRLKQPMLTLMAGSASHEIRFSVLKHVSLMVSRCPEIFDDEFKQFYCHYNEPWHVKDAKLDILPVLTNESNVTALVQELSEYVGDVDQAVAKKALKAIGRMAVRIPASADSIINILLEFIEMDIDFVRSGVVCVVKDLLRKYPDRAVDVLPSLPRCARRVDDEDGKAAVIFMIGEYGASMREAPYLLERHVDNYATETSVVVKSTLLIALLKLFLKRAPECQGMFERLMQMMLNDTSDSDVHDRALLLYRVMKTDMSQVERVFALSKDMVTSFTEERDAGIKQRLFEEFNTLSVMYHMPAEKFIDVSHREKNTMPEAVSELAQAAQTQDATAASPDEDEDEGVVGSIDVQPDMSSEVAEGELLGDLLGFDTSPALAAATPPLARPVPKKQVDAWALKPNPTVDQATYQSKWEALPSHTFDVQLQQAPSDASLIESMLGSEHVMCMASGDVGTHLKLYFFAQDNRSQSDSSPGMGSYYFAEVIVDKNSAALSATLKGEDEEMVYDFEEVVRRAIAPLV